MDKMLFKLKMDGRTTGYMRVHPIPALGTLVVQYWNQPDLDAKDGYWDSVCLVRFKSALLLVCYDQESRPIFDGDYARASDGVVCKAGIQPVLRFPSITEYTQQSNQEPIELMEETAGQGASHADV